VFWRRKDCMRVPKGDRRLEAAAVYEHTSWGVSLRGRSPCVGKVWIVESYQGEAMTGGSGGLVTNRGLRCGHGELLLNCAYAAWCRNQADRSSMDTPTLPLPQGEGRVRATWSQEEQVRLQERPTLS
jgi:hypothetical protein